MRIAIFLLTISIFIFQSAIPVKAADVSYDLPYPGILPDSPLWPIKDLRDKVVGLFIFDPVVKGQYQIRLGDKKLAMAEVLINNGQEKLGQKVLSWAADDFQAAIDKTNEAKLKQLDYAPLVSRLSLFAKKYEDNPALAKPVERVNKLFVENLVTP